MEFPKICLRTLSVLGSDRRLATQMGADEYFTKPFDVQELVAKVDELTGHA